MTDVHETTQTALCEGEADDAAVAHAEQCDECAAFARDVARLTAVAGGMAPAAPPAGLADRVVAGLSLGSTPKPLAVSPAVRRGVMRSLAIAAAALLVVGTVAVFQRDGGSEDPEQQLLLAASERTEEAGTAQVEVSVEAEVAVAPSDFDALPEELEAVITRRWEQAMAAFEQQLAEFERQVDRSIDEALRQIEEQAKQFGRGSVPPRSAPTRPTLPTPPTAPRGDRPQRPTTASVGLSLQGAGAVDFDGGLSLDATLKPVAGTVPVPSSSARVQVAAGRDRAAVSRPSGGWAEAAPDGPLGQLLLRPDAVLRLVRSADDVRRDGDRLAFTTKLDGPVQATGEGRATIGPDGRLSHVEVLLTGLSPQGMGWRTTVAYKLSGFGGAVAVGQAPATSAKARAGAGSSAVVYPLGAAWAATLEQ